MAVGVIATGCAAPAPKTESSTTPIAKESPKVEASAKGVPAQPTAVVALVEPYLMAVTESQAVVIPPPSLRGQILTPLPISPLSPAPPTQTVPIDPKPAAPRPSAPAIPSAPSQKIAKATIPLAVVRLLEDERSRSAEDARRRLTAAVARAAQTAAEAKRQWGFVKEGFVAQKMAEGADAAARDAAQEQADAQKALDAAQQRQKEARRDLQAAYGAVASADPGFVEASLQKPLPAYRPVPFTYRLSLLGKPSGKPTVENGTLGRTLPAAQNEGGAWIVRCADPSRLKVTIGGQAATLVNHPLPPAQAPDRGV